MHIPLARRTRRAVAGFFDRLSQLISNSRIDEAKNSVLAFKVLELGLDIDRRVGMESVDHASKERGKIRLCLPKQFTSMLVRVKELQPQYCSASNIRSKDFIGRVDQLVTSQMVESHQFIHDDKKS